MARMNRKGTLTGRQDPEFKKWIDDMCRFKTYQEKESINASRITQAIYNLRKKYPIDEELRKSKLGKWKAK